MQSVQIGKTMTTITLWALWKYQWPTLWYNKHSSLRCVAWDMGELAGSSPCQYDNMQGSPDIVKKRWKQLLHLWKTLPLFTMSTQEPQWKYWFLWSLSWISTNVNTFYKVRDLVLGYFTPLYRKVITSWTRVQVIVFGRFFS